MPLFGFGKQRFDPDRAFALRFLKCLGCMVGMNAIHIRLKERAKDVTITALRMTVGSAQTDFALPRFHGEIIVCQDQKAPAATRMRAERQVLSPLKSMLLLQCTVPSEVAFHRSISTGRNQITVNR